MTVTDFPKRPEKQTPECEVIVRIGGEIAFSLPLGSNHENHLATFPAVSEKSRIGAALGRAIAFLFEVPDGRDVPTDNQ